jgi:hypothetical protein
MQEIVKFLEGDRDFLNVMPQVRMCEENACIVVCLCVFMDTCMISLNYATSQRIHPGIGGPAHPRLRDNTTELVQNVFAYFGCKFWIYSSCSAQQNYCLVMCFIFWNVAMHGSARPETRACFRSEFQTSATSALVALFINVESILRVRIRAVDGTASGQPARRKHSRATRQGGTDIRTTGMPLESAPAHCCVNTCVSGQTYTYSCT